jgi:hypothetical protein
MSDDTWLIDFDRYDRLLQTIELPPLRSVTITNQGLGDVRVPLAFRGDRRGGVVALDGRTQTVRPGGKVEVPVVTASRRTAN